MAAVELATAYVTLVPSAAGIAASLATELGGPLEDAATASGAAASDGWGKAFAIGAGVAAVAVIAGLAQVGGAFDEAGDKIRVTTGATGPVLDSLKTSFENVVKSVPADMGDAATAISTLNQSLGLTGAPLEALATQVLDLSHITGTDLATNVQAAAGVFNSWGTSVADQSPKLDELFRVSQSTGISVSDLATQMTTGGVAFRSAGLDFESSASLLGLLAKNGLSASDVVPALGKVMATAAKDGKPAADVFRDTFDQIKNAPDDTAAAGAALDVFGAKAGPKMAALIREGKLSYEELSASISAGGDTIGKATSDTADWQEKLTLLKNQGMVLLAPIAAQVFGAIGTAISFVTPILRTLAAGFQSALGWLMDHKEILIGVAVVVGAVLLDMFVTWAIAAGTAAVATIVAAAPFIALGAAVALVVAAVIWAVENFDIFTTAAGAVRDAFVAVYHFIADNIIAILKTLIEIWLAPLILTFMAVKAVLTDVLIPAFQSVWNFITNSIIPIFQAIADKVTSVAGWIGDRVTDVVNFVIGIPGRIASVAVTMFDGIKSAITGAWQWVTDKIDSIVSIATGIPGRIANVFVGMWDGIKDAFKAAVNAIIRFWNGLDFKLPTITIYNPFGDDWTIGGETFGLPDIPEWHHTGGVVSGAPGADTPIVARAGELVLTGAQQAQLFAMANGAAAGNDAPPIVINNNRRDLGVADLNQVLAMARLAS